MAKYEIYQKQNGAWVKVTDPDAKVSKSGDTVNGIFRIEASGASTHNKVDIQITDGVREDIYFNNGTGAYACLRMVDDGITQFRRKTETSSEWFYGPGWEANKDGTFKAYSTDAGGTNFKTLLLKPDGHLSWSGTSLDVGVNSSHNSFIQQVDDGNQGSVFINGGYGTTGGAYIALNGKSKATYPGVFGLYASDGSNSSQLTGYPDGTLTWRGKNIPVPDSDGTNGQVLTSNGTSKPEWKTITGTPYYTHNIVLKNTVTGGNIEMVAFRFTNTVSTAYTTQKTISQALYALGHKGETTAIPASGRYSTSDTYYLMAYGASGSYAQIWILSSNTNTFGTSGWESITDTVTRSA